MAKTPVVPVKQAKKAVAVPTKAAKKTVPPVVPVKPGKKTDPVAPKEAPKKKLSKQEWADKMAKLREMKKKK